jgi:hypothetical protein
MRCDVIAEGIVAAAVDLNLKIPIVCRLQVYLIYLKNIISILGVCILLCVRDSGDWEVILSTHYHYSDP